jgi:anti-sigma B factor antagonist
MNLTAQIIGRTLRVGGISELSAANAKDFLDSVLGAMAETVTIIEIDFSPLKRIDSCGLGALISLRKACGKKGGMRLLDPAPSVQQIFELTRMHRVFEIVNSRHTMARSRRRLVAPILRAPSEFAAGGSPGQAIST